MTTFEGLIPLAQYSAPSRPTDERVRAWRTRLKAMFLSRSTHSVIAAERLETPSLKRLDDAAEPPACGPVIEDIERAMAQWLALTPPNPRILAMILPPTEENDVLGSWAREAGHTVLDPPPARTAPADLSPIARQPRDGVLVIPRLERWMLRGEGGLANPRALFAALEGTGQRVLVGCNSFAWLFLTKALGLDLLIPQALTFAPFDGPRLQDWLTGLARDEIAHGVDFRMADDGGALLGPDARGDHSDFFASLAGRSRGIPWIAWHMWRNVLRLDEDDSVPQTGGAAEQDRRTFWIAALEELVLPGDYPRDLLFALHALALHGAMTRADLATVMPEGLGPQIVGALVHSRFVRRTAEGRLVLEPEAYPAIRDGLQAAGFPVGAI